ncbi:MAG: hypothetical protein NXI31_05420 [bacterium]|nr:hypothetical protein [bacterium]
MFKIETNPPHAQLKQFAFIAVVGLPLIALVVLRFCGYGWAFGHPAVLTALGVGVFQLAVFLAGFQPLTRIIFIVLMVVALPIGFVLSHVLMAAIFYLVMTPIGLIFKLIGRDAMGKRPDPNAKTYWVDRGAARSPASYFKLY